MANVKNFRKEIKDNKTHIKAYALPQYIESIDGLTDLEVEYAGLTPLLINQDEIDNDPVRLKKQKEKIDIDTSFYQPYLDAEVIIDSIDTDLIEVHGRHDKLIEKEKASGINYPREFVWVEGAHDKSGVIILPCDDYDKVYVASDPVDDPVITFVGSEQETGGVRPYYTKPGDGKTYIYVDHFSGGGGTQADPYLISTPAEFDNIRNTRTAYYKLTNDIDFNGYGTISPIGYSTSAKFSGTFDGDGHVIKNINVNGGSATAYMGIFGSCASATIINVKFENPTVTAGQYLGGLVGGSYPGVTIKQVAIVGGSVTSTSSYAGGMIGQFYTGANTWVIQDCYTSTTVSGTGSCGGFFGQYRDTYSKVTRCWSASVITGTGTSYGFTGYTYAGAQTYTYWDKTVSGKTTDYAASGAVGKTTTEMKTQSTYVTYDFTNIWFMGSDGYPELKIFATAQPISDFSILSMGERILIGGNSILSAAENIRAIGTSTLPFLERVFNGVDSFPLLENIIPRGAGTIDDPYLLTDKADLQVVRDNPSWYFKMMADMDFNNTTHYPILNFTGVFDGNHHTIKNVHIGGANVVSSPYSTSKNGIFSNLLGATVKNLRVDNVTVDGLNTATYIGAIAGYASLGATITNCCATNVDFGDDTMNVLSYMGGILGYADSQVSMVNVTNCYASGYIYGKNYIGGIVGTAVYGINIADCFYKGTVNATFPSTNAGGIYGYASNSGSTLDRCYTILEGDSTSVKIASTANATVINNCYGLTLNAPANKLQSTYAGFDFTNVWFMHMSVNSGTPIQKVFLDSSKSYDNGTISVIEAVKSSGNATLPLNERILRTGSGSVNVTERIAEFGGSAYLPLIENIKASASATASLKEYVISEKGDGSSAHPYLISSSADLGMIRSHPTWYFKLMADINLAGVTWSPILNFTGNLDGNFHTISNFTVTYGYYNGSNAYYYYGFFDKLIAPSIVKNLKFSSVKTPSITGAYTYRYIGALAGYAEYSTFVNCGADVDFSTANKAMYVGGLIGYSYHVNFTGCYAKGSITADKAIGGMVAYADTSVFTDCFTDVYVKALTIDGYNPACGLVSNPVYPSVSAVRCATFGALDRTSYRGTGPDVQSTDCYVMSGALGSGETRLTASNSIQQSTYANWDFTNTWFIHGSVNNGHPMEKVFVDGSKSYSQGLITATERIIVSTNTLLPLREHIANAAGYDNSVILTEFVIMPESDILSVNENIKGTGTDIIPLLERIKGTAYATLPMTERGIGDTVEDYSMVFMNENVLINGNGTSSNPYLISTPQQLQTVTALDNDVNIRRYFKLVNDVDLTGYAWTPLTTLYGQFDGNGFKIKGITGTFMTGLSIDAVVMNVSFENVNIVSASAAYLFGTVTGTIKNISVKGSIRGTSACVINILSYSGSSSVGGELYDSSIFASLTATSGTAAPIMTAYGRSYSKAYIQRNYFAGTLSGNVKVAMISTIDLGGGSSYPVYSANYYDKDTSVYNQTSYATGLTDAQMKTQASFTGFDFTSVWTMDARLNSGYPVQKVFIPKGSSNLKTSERILAVGTANISVSERVGFGGSSTLAMTEWTDEYSRGTSTVSLSELVKGLDTKAVPIVERVIITASNTISLYERPVIGSSSTLNLSEVTRAAQSKTISMKEVVKANGLIKILAREKVALGGSSALPANERILNPSSNRINTREYVGIGVFGAVPLKETIKRPGTSSVNTKEVVIVNTMSLLPVSEKIIQVGNVTLPVFEYASEEDSLDLAVRKSIYKKLTE